MPAKNELREIKLWVREMIYKYHLAFHPDTPVAEYVDLDSGKQIFAEPAPLQWQLDRFFKICERRGIDIYALTFPIYRVFMKQLCASA